MTVPPCSWSPRQSRASAARVVAQPEIGHDADALGRDDVAVVEAGLAAQDASGLERGEVGFVECRARAGGEQSFEQRRIDARARAVRGQRPLQR